VTHLAIASAFVAKAVYGFTHTRQLLESLQRDDQLRRICGWRSAGQVPHEPCFSRAFAEFARMELPQFVHEATRGLLPGLAWLITDRALSRGGEQPQKARLLSPDTIDLPLDHSLLQRGQRQTQE